MSDPIVPPDASGAPAFSRDKHGAIRTSLVNHIKAIERPDLCGFRFSADTRRWTLRSSVLSVIDVSEDGAEWRPLCETDITKLRINLERLGFKTPSKTAIKDAIKYLRPLPRKTQGFPT